MNFDIELNINRHFKAVFWCGLAGLAALYFWFASSRALGYFGEYEFVKSALEMFNTGNYLYPTCNSTPDFSNPPLYYWLTSFAIKILGPTTLAGRLWPVIGVISSIVITYLIGNNIADRKVGLWSALIFGTCSMSLLIGNTAWPDAVGLPFFLFGIYLFLNIQKGKFRIWKLLLLIFAITLAFMGMGVKALFLPTIFIASVFCGRKYLNKSGLFLFVVILAFICGIGIWFFWAFKAYAAMGGSMDKMEYFFSLWYKFQGVKGFLFLPVYIPILLAGLFPWIFFAPQAFRNFIRERSRSSFSGIFILVWAAICFLLLMFSPDNRIQNIWPAVPAFSIMIGVYLADETKAERDAYSLVGLVLFSVLAFHVVINLLGFVWWQPQMKLRILGSVICLFFLILLIRFFFGKIFSLKKYRQGLVISTVWIFFLVFVGVWIVPGFEKYRVLPKTAKKLVKKVDESATVISYKYSLPNLEYYLNREIKQFNHVDGVIHFVRQRDNVYVLMNIPQWREDKEKLKAEGLAVFHERHGYNFSNGKRQNLLVLKKCQKSKL